MKKFTGVAVVALSSLLAFSVLAACGGETPSEEEGLFARICYDNLNAENSYLDERDTKIAVTGSVKEITAKDEAGEETDASGIALFDSSTNTFHAVSEGTVDFELDGKKSRIEVVPAYVTNPGNAYTGTSLDTVETQSAQLGNTHDPSFIAREEGGKTVYYLFSTGWNNLSNYDKVQTFGNAIHRSEDGMRTWEFVGRTFSAETRDDMLL